MTIALEKTGDEAQPRQGYIEKTSEEKREEDAGQKDPAEITTATKTNGGEARRCRSQTLHGPERRITHAGCPRGLWQPGRLDDNKCVQKYTISVSLPTRRRLPSKRPAAARLRSWETKRDNTRAF